MKEAGEKIHQSVWGRFSGQLLMAWPEEACHIGLAKGSFLTSVDATGSL